MHTSYFCNDFRFVLHTSMYQTFVILFLFLTKSYRLHHFVFLWCVWYSHFSGKIKNRGYCVLDKKWLFSHQLTSIYKKTPILLIPFIFIFLRSIYKNVWSLHNCKVWFKFRNQCHCWILGFKLFRFCVCNLNRNLPDQSYK